MTEHKVQNTGAIEDSSPIIPSIIIPIPAKYIKSRNKSQDYDQKDKNESNETRPQTRKSTINDCIVPKKIHISPIIPRKTSKTPNQLIKNPVRLSQSKINSRSKPKIIKCDLKKGIFSSKQNVFIENSSKISKLKARNSVSPSTKLLVKPKESLAIVSNLKAVKENLDVRRKNWRVALKGEVRVI